MTFTLLILVCAGGLGPAACTSATAIHRIPGPPAANELACARQAQMFAAELALVHNGDVVRVLCSRRRTATAAE